MPKKATTKKRTKPAELEDLTQVDGKNWQEEAEKLARQKKALAALWGLKSSRYNTDDPKVYYNSLRAMSKFDMWKECARIEISPHDNREYMIERLLKAFKAYVSVAKGPTQEQRPVEPIEISERSKRILSNTATLLS